MAGVSRYYPCVRFARGLSPGVEATTKNRLLMHARVRGWLLIAVGLLVTLLPTSVAWPSKVPTATLTVEPIPRGQVPAHQFKVTTTKGTCDYVPLQGQDHRTTAPLSKPCPRWTWFLTAPMSITITARSIKRDGRNVYTVMKWLSCIKGFHNCRSIPQCRTGTMKCTLKIRPKQDRWVSVRFGRTPAIDGGVLVAISREMVGDLAGFFTRTLEHDQERSSS